MRSVGGQTRCRSAPDLARSRGGTEGVGSPEVIVQPGPVIHIHLLYIYFISRRLCSHGMVRKMFGACTNISFRNSSWGTS